MERPGDLAAPEAPANSTRVRGQPAPGRKRRTAAEVAEDLAHAQTDRPAQVPAAISSGEARVHPQDEAQDAADEAAESAARAGGPPTMDDLRAAVKRYADKFGPEAAINNVRGILGKPMLGVAPTDIPSAIAKMDLAANAASQETSLFDDAPPAARVATKQDIIAAMTAYCVKYDGTDDPNKAPNGQADLPRIMEKACGAPRISLLPQTPEGFGAAVVAIEEATKNNFLRPAGAPMITFDLVQHLHRQSRWSEQTFGPGNRTNGVVDHIRKELREIEAAPTDLMEWVDVIILGLDGAWRSGATPEQIAAAILAKQMVNENRKWPDWQTQSADKAIEHNR